MAVSQSEHPASDTGDLDRDYRRLKGEILAELPERRRLCLYHPAWTAAAALILLAAVWLRLGHRHEPMAPSRKPPPASRTPADSIGGARERLPPSRPGSSPGPTSRPAEPANPILAEAAVSLSEVQVGENQAAPEAEIIFLASPAAPPELIRRPRPVDAGKLALDLAALAGLQIGSGDWDDAKQTIGMLSKYSPEKADELSSLLVSVRDAASPADNEPTAALENAAAVEEEATEEKGPAEAGTFASAGIEEAGTISPAGSETVREAAAHRQVDEAEAEPGEARAWILPAPAAEWEFPIGAALRPSRSYFSTDPYVRDN